MEGAAEPLPHPPAELRAEALPIREQLAAAGFTTPALDALIGNGEIEGAKHRRQILPIDQAIYGASAIERGAGNIYWPPAHRQIDLSRNEEKRVASPFKIEAPARIVR